MLTTNRPVFKTVNKFILHLMWRFLAVDQLQFGNRAARCTLV